MSVFLVEKLYEELYEPKLLPQDLLSNLELQNYKSIKFKQEKNTTIAIVQCYLADGELATYNYFFNENKLDKLLKVNEGENNTILYDRSYEICKLRKKLKLERAS